MVTGATVKVKNLSTNAERITRSSATGDYTVVGLGPATYEVIVTASAFKPFTAKVEVTVGSQVTLAAKLSVAASTTEVQVVAEGGTAVNTQSQGLSQVIGAQQLEHLPSLTRDPYDFVALAGNVSNGDNTTVNANSGQNVNGRGVGYAINGQRETGTEILLDGVENVAVMNYSVGQRIPMDAMQEYSIITNNYSAEYGRASGGIVNVTTKPGTSSIHGSAWEFNRLSAYTANTYNNDAENAAAGSPVAPKGRYARNQSGFQVGGPVVKDKLFFMASSEWLLVRSSASESEEIFDPQFVSNYLPANTQAYFKAYGANPYPASSSLVTTAGTLSSSGYPIGLINGITAVPSGAAVFDAVNFRAPYDAGGGDPGNTLRLVGRLDYTLESRTQMFGRVAIENADAYKGSWFYSGYPQYDVGSSNLNQSYLYSLAHSFSPNLFGDAKLSFTRYNASKSFDTSLLNTPSLIFTPASDPVTGGYVQMPGLINTGNGSGSLPNQSVQNTFQFAPDLAWNKGRHLMRFGGQLTYIQLNAAYTPYAQAQEQLGWTYQQSMADLANNAGAPGGSTLESFEAGINPQGIYPCVANPGFWASGAISDLNTNSDCALGTTLSAPNYGRSYRYSDWNLYTQDSYKLLRRLTVSYGLRYEHYGVQHDSNQSLDSNFYLGAGSSFLERVRNGSVQLASKMGGMYAPRWGTVAPRLGFAWDPFGTSKTSVRGGFGISYERDYARFTYNAAFTPPSIAVLTSMCAAASGTCTAVVTNSNLGTSQGYLPPVSVQMVNPNIKVASTQFWSLAFQREVARNSVVELSYSGAHGVHLYDNFEINMLGAGQFYLNDPLTFAQSPDCASPCLNRPNDQYSMMWMHSSSGSSSYQALNAKLQVQNIHHIGLSLVTNYTWSHSLDEVSATDSMDSLQGEYLASYGYLNFLDPKLDWGNSDFDVRHRLVVSPVWDLAWFKSGSGWKNRLLSGWSVSGLFTARSGTPFTVYDFSNNYNDCTIPRLTPATPISNYHVSSRQNIGTNEYAAMTLPLPASFAPLDPTLGIDDYGPFSSNMTHRNAFLGPGAWNMDLAASKRVKLSERVAVELRVEGFDALNHHNYYVNTATLAYDGPTTTPLQVIEMKGGLGSAARGGGNHDERRFGQFALRVSF
jgi:hypothetical protein